MTKTTNTQVPASNAALILVKASTYSSGQQPVWQGIWLKFNGEPRKAGTKLNKHYATLQTAQELIDGGHLLFLEDELEESLTYERAFESLPNFYRPIIASTPDSLIERMRMDGCNYAYLWTGKKWQTRDIAPEWTF